MAGSPIEDVTNAVKDAAYVSVGLGVIAFQRLQVRRNELSRSLSGSTGEARGALELVTNLVGERVKHDDGVGARLHDLVEVADRAFAHRPGERPILPFGAVVAHQVAPDEVGRR